ncbi:general substrate transporter [Lecanosticta acicola]|uniref:General substrate transporter n=1 Tax=Lecanosticta acicola TaxID=111012 RepID=A0AAI8YZC2_9PEZI|nr:general substrate transporter [Lecanosticta acicola]
MALHDSDILPENNTHPKWWKDPGLRTLNFLILGIISIQITSGYDQVVVGSFQAMRPWLNDMGNPGPSRMGLITTATFIGSLVGSLPASSCSDRFGRKSGLLLGSLATIAGSIFQTAARGYIQFTFGRALVGVGISFNVIAGPSLIAELAHPRQRGAVSGFFNTLWYVGSIAAAFTSFGTGHLKTSWSWRIPSLLQVLPPLFLLSILRYIPESPRYLLARGREQDAYAMLVKYHANGHDNDKLVEWEIQGIKNDIETEVENARAPWSTLWDTKASLKRTLCVLSVAFLCLWSGQSFIGYYFSPILSQVGILGTARQTGINGALQVSNLATSLAGALLADRIGRRALWMISVATMILANAGTIVASAKATDNSNAASHTVVVFLFIYSAGYTIACNPLCYAYPAELLPFSVRTKGLSVYVFFSYILATVDIYVNPIALAAISWRFWFVYLGLLVSGFVLVYFAWAETKGLSLEATGRLFDKGSTECSGKLEGYSSQITSD